MHGQDTPCFKRLTDQLVCSLVYKSILQVCLVRGWTVFLLINDDREHREDASCF